MRKISTLAAKAFFKNTPFRRGNTKVVVQDGITRLLLHGNAIATRSPSGDVSISLAGWPTALTRARLNALLRETGSGHLSVCQIRGRQFISNISTNNLIPVSATVWTQVAH